MHMFSVPTLHGSVSICSRCRYRLFIKRQCLVRGPSHKHTFGQQKKFSCYRRLANAGETQENDGPGTLEPLPTPEWPKRTPSEQKGWSERRIFLHTKDALGVDALGHPAEALVVAPPNFDRYKTIRARNSEEELLAENVASPDDLLARIEAEKETVDGPRVAKTLEDIRDTWAANSQRAPTQAPFSLKQTVYETFSTKQLWAYYLGGNPAPSSDNIDLPYTTSSYTRSSWVAGTTPYPGEPSIRCSDARTLADALAAARPDSTSDELPQWDAHAKQPPFNKGPLIDKILSERWGIRLTPYQEPIGELELWLQREHISLLMNHARDPLRRLAERYGAKIDASRSLRFLRITGERGACYDILQVLVYTTEHIESEEVDLPVVRALRSSKATKADIKDLFWEELQQITNTVITFVTQKSEPGEPWKAKIHYLGPSKDDLADAHRLISQAGKALSSLSRKAYWGDVSPEAEVRATPIEAGPRLPLIHRGQQWSRWALAVKRPHNLEEPQEENPIQNMREKTVRKALKAQLLQQGLTADVSHEQFGRWPKSTQQSGSVILGQILFPTQVVQDLKLFIPSKDGQRKLSPTFIKTLSSPHQFISTNLGMGISRFRATDNKIALRDSLYIRLTPTPLEDQSAQSNVLLPDLEIRVDINQEHRKLRVGRVRLVFGKQETDLLMPDQWADLRFSSEQYATYEDVNIHGGPPQVEDFVRSSKLDVWGTGRLKTPITLRLPIPRYSSGSSGPFEDAVAPLNIDYTFAKLEHHSNLVYDNTNNISTVYSVIEAGRTGGRREEVSVNFRKIDFKRDGISLYSYARQLTQRAQSDSQDRFKLREDQKALISPYNDAKQLARRAHSDPRLVWRGSNNERIGKSSFRMPHTFKANSIRGQRSMSTRVAKS